MGRAMRATLVAAALFLGLAPGAAAQAQISLYGNQHGFFDEGACTISYALSESPEQTTPVNPPPVDTLTGTATVHCGVDSAGAGKDYIGIDLLLSDTGGVVWSTEPNGTKENTCESTVAWSGAPATSKTVGPASCSLGGTLVGPYTLTVTVYLDPPGLEGFAEPTCQAPPAGSSAEVCTVQLTTEVLPGVANPCDTITCTAALSMVADRRTTA